MRAALLTVVGLALLSGCGEQEQGATYTCPRGPDLTVVYAESGATLYFPDGRVELLPRPYPDRPNLYAKPGFVWAVGNREARLDDGLNSFTCDQMAG